MKPTDPSNLRVAGPPSARSPGLGDAIWSIQSKYAPYLFVSPFVILFGVFMLYPLARSLSLSFYQTYGPNYSKFVGLGNYRFLMQDKVFWLAVLNTTLYTVGFLIIQIPASLLLAILLNNRLLRGRSFFRFAFFSSNLVGHVFVAVLFSILLNPRHGLINRALSLALPGDVQLNWLSNPMLALPATLIAGLWLAIGFGMIYFLAALQAVDKDLYEAAEVDGAGTCSQFWHVTIPGIRPVMIFMILIGTIGAFQLFELPYVMFQGPGPNYSALTIVMYLFMMGFEVGDLGYGAAIGWMLVIIIFLVSLAQLRTARETG